MNAVSKASQWLTEHYGPKEFGDQIEAAISLGGVVVMHPDCFLTGFPDPNDRDCLIVTFQTSVITRLCRVLQGLGFKRVKYQRTKNTEWVTRDVAHFARHMKLGESFYI